MKHNFVVAGFRHGHIYSLIDRVAAHPDCRIAAACEEDPAARAAVRKDIDVQYGCLTDMLDRTECDVVAIGDYYAKRGAIAIEALKRGKHVISDKPLCTSLKELEEIAGLAEANHLKVGCMLDLRENPAVVSARNAILQGMIGEVAHIQFGGQHPLLPGSRAAWYFEAGKHGGTINDIGTHAVDLIPWMTGHAIRRIVAARSWRALPNGPEGFQDAGEFMLELDNGAGVLGDVSYQMANTQGYTLPTYWRFNVWGTRGMLEFNYFEPHVRVYADGCKDAALLGTPADTGMNYLESFLHDIAGSPQDLATETVLAVTRQTLEIQAAGDADGH